MKNHEAGERITQAHGNGGKMTRELITSVFLNCFNNAVINEGLDAGRLDLHAELDRARRFRGIEFPASEGRVAMTTDSYVVTPLFFPGGDIGKLAATGTLNDLAVTGAIPLAMTAGFIIEEGFLIEDLLKITRSMAQTASDEGVLIAAGDTKVVGRGRCDGVYINTTGIGVIADGADFGPWKMEEGDSVIVTGPPGSHGLAILNARGGYVDAGEVVSDCAPLAGPLLGLAAGGFGVRVMRDATRGGLATTLNEFAAGSGKLGIMIEEDAVRFDRRAGALADMLGVDLLYSACEGMAVIVCAAEREDDVLGHLKKFTASSGAAAIGRVTLKNAGRVVIKTGVGGGRFLEMRDMEQFPRIC